MEDRKEQINDKEEALKAISEDPLKLRFCSEELKKNEQLVALAIKAAPYALIYVSEELRNNREFMTRLAKSQPAIMEEPSYINPFVKDQKFVADVMKEISSENLEYLSSSDNLTVRAIASQQMMRKDEIKYTPEQIAEGISPNMEKIQEFDKMVAQREERQTDKEIE